MKLWTTEPSRWRLSPGLKRRHCRRDASSFPYRGQFHHSGVVRFCLICCLLRFFLCGFPRCRKSTYARCRSARGYLVEWLTFRPLSYERFRNWPEKCATRKPTRRDPFVGSVSCPDNLILKLEIIPWTSIGKNNCFDGDSLLPSILYLNYRSCNENNAITDKKLQSSFRAVRSYGSRWNCSDRFAIPRKSKVSGVYTNLIQLQTKNTAGIDNTTLDRHISNIENKRNARYVNLAHRMLMLPPKKCHVLSWNQLKT